MPIGVENPPIAALPDSAIDLPPAVAAVEVSPAPGAYPDRAVVGESFEIRVLAFAPATTPPLRGVLRWRRALAPRWEEQPLQRDGDKAFSLDWSPPAPGDYEWCIELWHGDSDLERNGSSGADVLHLLRAERNDVAGARWQQLPRAPLRDLSAALNSDAQVLLLAPIFPLGQDGRVGRDGAGHYSIDPALGDTRDFGEFAAAARAAGTALALTLPIECSPEHPLRERYPSAFANSPQADLAGEHWRDLWQAWESVFRFWLVQGIDIFHIPTPADAPVSFWATLLENLRDDFPTTVFTAPASELEKFGEHLLGSGFIATPRTGTAHPSKAPAPAPDPIAPDSPRALDPLPLVDEDDPERNISEPAPRLPPAAATTPEKHISCSSSNPNLDVRINSSDRGIHLSVENSDPRCSQSGHIHIDGAALGITEHDLYYLRDLDDNRAYRWSGTTNFLSLASGETAKVFRLERN